MSFRVHTHTPLSVANPTPRSIVCATAPPPRRFTHRRVVSDPTPAQILPLHRIPEDAPNWCNAPNSFLSCSSRVSPPLDSSTTSRSEASSPARSISSSISSISTCLDTHQLQSPDRFTQAKLESSGTSPLCDLASVGVPEMPLLEAGLELLVELGKSNQSSVHLAQKTPQGSLRCVKRFDKAGMNEAGLEFMKGEYEVMQKIGGHSSIAQAFDMFQDTSFFYVELEFYSGGNFTDLKRNAVTAGVPIEEKWWGRVFEQCLLGLQYVHGHGFVHCDIKEPNLMVKTQDYREPEVVLIDFGVVQAGEEKRTVIYGTPGYIPPEVWKSKTWCCEGDLFSFGVVVLQMLIDRVPDSESPRCGIFTESTQSFSDIKAATRTREPPFDAVPPCYAHLQQLTRKLLVKDPSQRPNAAQALSFLDEWRPTMSGDEASLNAVSLIQDSADLEDLVEPVDRWFTERGSVRSQAVQQLVDASQKQMLALSKEIEATQSEARRGLNSAETQQPTVAEGAVTRL